MIRSTATTTIRVMKTVQFRDPVSVAFWFEGVREEERDDVWFRRADYVDFVEQELRRRELLTQIENKDMRAPRRASDMDTSKSTTETAMKHTFTRRMVSRTFSAGPNVRRRRLPQREKNELDVSNHASQLAMGKQRPQVRPHQQPKETEQKETGDDQKAPPTGVETPKHPTVAPAARETKFHKDQAPQQPRRSICEEVATPLQMEPMPMIRGNTSPPQALTV